MRHGLTLPENSGHWFIETLGLSVDYRVIEMQGWRPDAAPGFGLASGRTHVDQSQSQRTECFHGALLRRHRDARRQSTLSLKGAAPHDRSR